MYSLQMCKKSIINDKNQGYNITNSGFLKNHTLITS